MNADCMTVNVQWSAHWKEWNIKIQWWLNELMTWLCCIKSMSRHVCIIVNYQLPPILILLRFSSSELPKLTGEMEHHLLCSEFHRNSGYAEWSITCITLFMTGWEGKWMYVPPAAVNDPMFNMYHCNVDQILESWIQRFANGGSNPMLLLVYVPASGGHPWHNRGDYMVPYFPLITAIYIETSIVLQRTGDTRMNI